MKLTQGTFSFLPDLTDAEISKQVEYCLGQGWAVAVEFTDDPHPRNSYWEMWGLPMFDLRDPAGAMMEIRKCRETHPNKYVKVIAIDNRKGFESLRLSFIVNRPKNEPGFEIMRTNGPDRQIHYGIRAYSANRPEGERYED
jgi:ribulose-bisphosphate carboxylase small chain